MAEIFMRLSESNVYAFYINLFAGVLILLYLATVAYKNLTCVEDKKGIPSKIDSQIQKTLISIPIRPKKTYPSYIKLQKKKRELRRLFLEVEEQTINNNSPKNALKKVRSLNRKIFEQRCQSGYRELYIIQEVLEY